MVSFITKGNLLPVKRGSYWKLEAYNQYFFHMFTIIVYETVIWTTTAEALNAKQSASDCIVLEYFLRPVLYSACLYAKGKHNFFCSVVHKLVPFWGLDLCAEKEQYVRDKKPQFHLMLR